MEPEIIVPSDMDTKLKPYVSYKSDVHDQPEFTARALFDNFYRTPIQQILANTELSEEDKVDKLRQFTEVDEESVHESRIRARQSGSDLFVQRGWYGIGRERDDNWN